jgi:large subunit ribosomal protein L7A
MLAELTNAEKVVGAKQVKRALKDGRAKKLFWAENADPRVLQPLVQDAVRKHIPLEQVGTMKALGEACGISVGAAVAVLL